MDFGRAWIARADEPCLHAAAPRAGGGFRSAPDTAIKQTLPAARRLRERSEFRTVYEQGTRRHSPHFVVFALHHAGRRLKGAGKGLEGRAEEPGLPEMDRPEATQPMTESRPPSHAPSRFGITVSRKVGRATVRNRIRRRTREVLRRHMEELGSGWDIVINPRRTVLEAEFAVLEEELIGQLRRLTSPDAARRP